MDNNLPKELWPGWETVQLLGRGSFGSVYEIRRAFMGLEERAALKLISIPQSISEIDEMRSYGYDEKSITGDLERQLKGILGEYAMMRRLNGSGNVVNCDDVRYEQHPDGIGWDIFIKMELLTPLTKALGPDTPEETVRRIGIDLCKALVLCGKNHIVHRDIKPQNIFVSDNGDYKLGDFGVARTMEKMGSGTRIGTYNYIAPEVYNGQPYGHSVDIYSLGLVLYWLLNERRLPFCPLPPAIPSAGDMEEARRRRLQGEPLPAPKNGSNALKSIVLKACAYDPAQRYQTAEEMLRDLERPEKVVREDFDPAKNEVLVLYGPPRWLSEEEEATEGRRGRSKSQPDSEEETMGWGQERPTPEDEGTQGAWGSGNAERREEADPDGTQGAFPKQKKTETPRKPGGEEPKPKAETPPRKEETPPKQPPVPTPPPKSKKGLVIGILAAVAVLAVLAVLIFHPFGGASSAPAPTAAPAAATAKPAAATAKPAESPKKTTAEYTVEVWVNHYAVELTKQQIEDFNQSNQDGLIIHATVKAYDEGSISASILEAPANCPDLCLIPSDSLGELVRAGLLDPLPTISRNMITEANSQGSVACASYYGTYYGYPITEDNGFFLYYDKSVIPEADLGSMEAIMGDCEAAGRLFGFELEGSAWYSSAFFFGTGCVSEWVLDSEGDPMYLDDSFNSPEGMIAAKGMKKLMDSYVYWNTSGTGAFGEGAAAVISGAWAADEAREILGSNFGAAELPSFTVDGRSYHLKSFFGSKLLAVKASGDTGRGAALHALARYLTGEQCQKERFLQLGFGPSNLNVQAMSEVKNDPVMRALLIQSEWSVPQTERYGPWWEAARQLAVDIHSASGESGIQSALDAYSDRVFGMVG